MKRTVKRVLVSSDMSLQWTMTTTTEGVLLHVVLQTWLCAFLTPKPTFFQFVRHVDRICMFWAWQVRNHQGQKLPTTYIQRTPSQSSKELLRVLWQQSDTMWRHIVTFMSIADELAKLPSAVAHWFLTAWIILKTSTISVWKSIWYFGFASAIAIQFWRTRLLLAQHVTSFSDIKIFSNIRAKFLDRVCYW